jgi:hypothetical protein
MRLRWPLVRRSHHDRVIDQFEECQRTSASQRRALANLGHERDRAFRDCARLMSDLRLARFHFDRNRSGVVTCTFTLVDEYLYRAYRHDETFRQMIGYMLERAFIEEFGPGAPYGIFDDRKSGLPE